VPYLMQVLVQSNLHAMSGGKISGCFRDRGLAFGTCVLSALGLANQPKSASTQPLHATVLCVHMCIT
jgi:hypothetical protein